MSLLLAAALLGHVPRVQASCQGRFLYDPPPRLDASVPYHFRFIAAPELSDADVNFLLNRPHPTRRAADPVFDLP